MRVLYLTGLICGLLFTGCKSTSTVYERNDLVTIAHNRNTDYTLLVYKSTKGRTRKVLRKNGVCELLLIETTDGEFWVKERGQDARKVPLASMLILEARLDELIYDNQVEQELNEGLEYN